MNSKTIREIAYLKAEKEYKRLSEEFDVVLPPEPLFPLSQRHALDSGNYAIEKAAIGQFVNTVVAQHGINQKIAVITIDTGAYSKNLATKKNFVMGGQDHTGDNETVDQHGHFSFCASQIAGVYKDALFGALAYPGLPGDFFFHTGEKGLNRNGGATFGMLNQALDVAHRRADGFKEKGYKVFINCSWGGNGGQDETMVQLFTSLRDKGHFPFVAAGNSGKSGVSFPGNIPADKIGHLLMTIGAVSRENNIASFSSTGNEVDFVSYGVSNYGAGPGENDFRTGSGTSYATPFALGCSALLVAVFPEIEDMNDLYYVLKNGAVDLGVKGKDKSYGHGLINMTEYGEDDLPEDDQPEEPGEPTQPVFPIREIHAMIPGEYRMKWATMDSNTATKQTGFVDSGPVLVDLDSPQAKAYNWKEMEYSAITVSLSTNKPADVAISEIGSFLKRFWPNGRRGILSSPPLDFERSGQIGLFFAKKLANAQENHGVNYITATAKDEQGNEAVVTDWRQ